MTLDYSASQQVEPRPGWRTVARIIALGTMGMGSAIFLVFFATRSEAVALFGLLFMVFGGLPLFAIGTSFLIAYVWRARRVGNLRPWRSAAGTALLLLANFPLAMMYCAIGTSILTAYRVTVVNKSTQTIVGLHIVAPGVADALPAIAPGKSIRRSYHFNGDGQLAFTFDVADTRKHEMIEGYVTNGQGGDATITFTDQGPVVQRDRR